MQRVPHTESLGRIHTSTMTVAVLPQPEEVQLHFNQVYWNDHIMCVQILGILPKPEKLSSKFLTCPQIFSSPANDISVSSVI